MGGAAKVRALAQAAYDGGDYGWAAELLNRAVFADGADSEARALLKAWQAHYGRNRAGCVKSDADCPL